MEALLDQITAETSFNFTKPGFSSQYYQPERLLLSSDQAPDLQVSQDAIEEDFFYTFTLKLPRPALDVKSIQLVRASLPNCCPNIPDTETTFWYYRIPVAVINALGNVFDPQYLKFVRLLPSWYKPELNVESANYGFNRTFTDYFDLAAELAKSCAADPINDAFLNSPEYQSALQTKTQAEATYQAAVVTRNQAQANVDAAQNQVDYWQGQVDTNQALYDQAVITEQQAQATYNQAVINEAAAYAYYQANPFDPFALQAWLDSIQATQQAQVDLQIAQINTSFYQTQLFIAQQNLQGAQSVLQIAQADLLNAQAAETAAFEALVQADLNLKFLINQQSFIPDDITLTYDQVQNKFVMTGLNVFDDNDDRQFYYIAAGYLDPNIWGDNGYGAIELTNDSANLDDFGLGVPPQQYQEFKDLNLRLGFTWNGRNNNLGTQDVGVNAVLAFRFRPIPPLIALDGGPSPLRWDNDAIAYTAESYANLVNTSCVNVYVDFITGATTDTIENTNLLAAVPMNASNLGVSFYNPVITNPLTKIMNQLYEMTITLRTDTGRPFYLPNSAIFSLELALTY